LGVWDVQYRSRRKGPNFSGVMAILNLKKKYGSLRDFAAMKPNFPSEL
jgi:hypothetical protein